jgi:hypothetical protein
MTKELLGNEEEVKTKSDKSAKVEMTIGDLEKIVGQIKDQSDDKMQSLAKMIADALIESKKPYVSPQQLENEETMRKSMREQRKRLEEDLEASKATCPHMQGSNALSDVSGPMTAIVQHRLDTGEVIGICTNCIRVFRQNDPDYLEWMRKKSGNKMSSAGIRMFMRPAEVMAAR